MVTKEEASVYTGKSRPKKTEEDKEVKEDKNVQAKDKEEEKAEDKKEVVQIKKAEDNEEVVPIIRGRQGSRRQRIIMYTSSDNNDNGYYDNYISRAVLCGTGPVN